MGRHTKWGGYVLDYKKIRTYVCPDLSKFNMTPFVTEEKYDKKHLVVDLSRRMSGDSYLLAWKCGGGEKRKFWRS